MSDQDYPEFKEGRDAFSPSKDPAAENPYPHDKQNWWRNEAWEKGWEEAKRERLALEKLSKSYFEEDDDD